MTIEELREKPSGVLEIRNITIKSNSFKSEEYYFLGKTKYGKYFIGFSENGSYCSCYICEEDMIEFINDKELSDEEASTIYILDPHLSCWINN